MDPTRTCLHCFNTLIYHCPLVNWSNASSSMFVIFGLEDTEDAGFSILLANHWTTDTSMFTQCERNCCTCLRSKLNWQICRFCRRRRSCSSHVLFHRCLYSSVAPRTRWTSSLASASASCYTNEQKYLQLLDKVVWMVNKLVLHVLSSYTCAYSLSNGFLSLCSLSISSAVFRILRRIYIWHVYAYRLSNGFLSYVLLAYFQLCLDHQDIILYTYANSLTNDFLSYILEYIFSSL